MSKYLMIGLVYLLSISVNANDCIKTAAAFDIGSGTTKIKVAKVDVCRQKIIESLYEEDSPVEYKQDLSESFDNKLSKKIIDFGSKSINILKEKVKKYNPSSYVAAATSAFRTAANGEFAVKQISKNTGIKIKIISQEMEAKIGFIGASSISDNDLKDVVVWDIGGGSMQMSSYDGQGRFNIYEGKLASVSFKNYVIEKLHNDKIEEVKSPNPISEDDNFKSLNYLETYAEIYVPQKIKNKLKSKNVQVIGIGGVHYYSVGKVVSKTKNYSYDMVINQINRFLNLNDEQLGGGKFVETSVSNLILVAGFMKALGITEVKTGKITMADGLLIKPEILD